MTSFPRLTALASGGGCGCKLPPDVLSKLVRAYPVLDPAVLVGLEHSDDAAVYQLNADQALVATVDFFTPIVDQPYDFGAISATNALSDVYAMGGTPIMALAVLGMPLDRISEQDISRILQGGQDVCHSAGIAVLGGHSIKLAEPVYGLVALGLVAPSQLKANHTAQAGDVLILSKPLGIGVLAAALKQGALSASAYERMRSLCCQLNQVGSQLGRLPQVHAMTDVTGFGLLGHAWEMARGAGLMFEISFSRLPLIAEAVALAQAGYVTGASERNRRSVGAHVRVALGLASWQEHLLTDPQTSGGLLLAVAEAEAESVLALLHQAGFTDSAVIGHCHQGPTEVWVGE